MRRLLLLLSMLGCVHTMQLVPSGPTMANGEGIEVRVGERQWSGSPGDLATLVTPLYVRVHNGSDQPVQIAYRNLTLDTNGMQASAIPPFHIQRAAGAPTELAATAYTHDSFLLYSPYANFYPAAPLWGEPWDFDPVYYDRMYGVWAPSLPTRDMLRLALPEGVLQPGGTAAGFLYFKTPSDPGQAAFSLELVQARTGEPLGEVSIPMTLK
jgi:hypothetical protein